MEKNCGTCKHYWVKENPSLVLPIACRLCRSYDKWEVWEGVVQKLIEEKDW